MEELTSEFLKLGVAGLICIVLIYVYLREAKKNDQLVLYMKEINEKRLTESRESLRILEASTIQLRSLEVLIKEKFDNLNRERTRR